MDNRLEKTNEKEFLKTYNASDYERPSVTVDNLIFTVGEVESDNYRKLDEKELQLLLIQRKHEPFQDMWAICGGFVDVNTDMSMEYTASRELEEETSLTDVYLEQLYTFGDKDRDPRTRVISVSYLALVPKHRLSPKAGDDAKNTQWFSIKSKLLRTIKEENYVEKIVELTLKSGDIVLTETIKDKYFIEGNIIKNEIEVENPKFLAFDHAKVIYIALQRLKNKIEYTDVAFHLMPEYFTWAELQQVYEVILDKEFSPANFRRKVKHLVIETNKTTKGNGKGCAPAKLLKFNKFWRFE